MVRKSLETVGNKISQGNETFIRKETSPPRKGNDQNWGVRRYERITHKKVVAAMQRQFSLPHRKSAAEVLPGDSISKTGCISQSNPNRVKNNNIILIERCLRGLSKLEIEAEDSEGKLSLVTVEKDEEQRGYKFTCTSIDSDPKKVLKAEISGIDGSVKDYPPPKIIVSDQRTNGETVYNTSKDQVAEIFYSVLKEYSKVLR